MSQPTEDPPIFRSMTQVGQPIAPEPPAPVNPQAFTAADVEALIKSKLDEVEARHAEQIKQLQDQLAARVVPNYVFTAHAAGPNYEIADTWSLREQELARAEAG